MSKFKIEFTLKQHTPIIHFQSAQPGATLRATELKPKFDAYLLEKEASLPVMKNANGHLSLDYKVTIQPNISARSPINPKDPLFFANMGLDKLPEKERLKQEKFFKESSKNFKITFFSFKPSVLEAIEAHFPSFMAQTNFGTRQSKGFGSFTVADRAFSTDLIGRKCYAFESTPGGYRKDIGLFYRFLRQGINTPKDRDACPQTKFYAKPAIFAYAQKKGWTWDKKAIKSYYFSDGLDSDIRCRGSVDVLTYEGTEAYLLRDLFGLSSEQAWLSYGETITKESDAVERFKSPITFKPVLENDKKMTVYFWADSEALKPILGKTFDIKTKRGRGLQLSTPKNFDFDDFFAFAFSLDLERHIDREFHSDPDFRTLSRIFNSIKVYK